MPNTKKDEPRKVEDFQFHIGDIVKYIMKSPFGNFTVTRTGKVYKYNSYYVLVNPVEIDPFSQSEVIKEDVGIIVYKKSISSVLVSFDTEAEANESK